MGSEGFLALRGGPPRAPGESCTEALAGGYVGSSGQPLPTVVPNPCTQPTQWGLLNTQDWDSSRDSRNGTVGWAPRKISIVIPTPTCPGMHGSGSVRHLHRPCLSPCCLPVAPAAWILGGSTEMDREVPEHPGLNLAVSGVRRLGADCGFAFDQWVPAWGGRCQGGRVDMMLSPNLAFLRKSPPHHTGTLADIPSPVAWSRGQGVYTGPTLWVQAPYIHTRAHIPGIHTDTQPSTCTHIVSYTPTTLI